MSQTVEEWRSIPGYEGFYEASDRGSVRRIADASPDGNWHLIAQNVDAKGYLRCKLSRYGVEKTHKVHRLVAAAFIGPCPPKRQVNHKDGDKSNNTIGNLEYVSNTRNRRHAVAHGLAVNLRGEAHPNAKIGGREVAQMRTLYRSGQYTQAALGQMFGLSQTQVRRILSGENWRRP